MDFTTEVIGNIFIRRMHFKKAGDIVESHKHNFDHCTMVLTGGVTIRLYEIIIPGTFTLKEEKDLWSPYSTSQGDEHAWMLIKKDLYHEITSLEDNTHCWCIFSHRDFEGGEVVEEYNGNSYAYD